MRSTHSPASLASSAFPYVDRAWLTRDPTRWTGLGRRRLRASAERRRSECGSTVRLLSFASATWLAFRRYAKTDSQLPWKATELTVPLDSRSTMRSSPGPLASHHRLQSPACHLATRNVQKS